MRKGKKKAFTLTELLVVVIVIGVLSAAVLPKFSKVIETRKTTEAEELMASVRTEQEKRCALDKPYLTAMSEMTDIVKNNGDTKNFTITLASSGIDAASKGKYSYTLKMPSYADGRICCDGTECSKLNKNYPTCDELRGKPDYQESPADCAGEVVPPEEELGPCDIDPYSCECNPNQEKCCAEGEVWQDGKCAPKPKECTGKKPSETDTCCEGTQRTRTVTCNKETGKWEYGQWNKTCPSCGGGRVDPDPENCCSCQSSSKDGEADCGEWMSSCSQNINFDYCRYQCGACDDWFASCGAWYSESSKKLCCTCSTECGGSDCGSDCGSGCGSDSGGSCGGSSVGGSTDDCGYVECSKDGDLSSGKQCGSETLGYHVDSSCNILYDYSGSSSETTYHCTINHPC